MKFLKDCWAHLKRAYLSLFLEKSMSSFLSMASAHPATSVCMEWSMTRFTGMMGLMVSGSLPILATASLMEARSVTAAPPVRS